MGCCAPVEVSAWTMPTAFTGACFFRASSMAACGKTWPQGTSSFTSLPPQRPTMSAMRLPKTPAAQTITVSPGSITLTSAASMPAEPVPETAMVKGFCGLEGEAELGLHLVHDPQELGDRGGRASGVVMAR